MKGIFSDELEEFRVGMGENVEMSSLPPHTVSQPH